MKILREIGRGFLPRLGSRFPRKNRVFIIFADFYFLLCEEQPVQTGLPASCENLARIGKSQFTPLLCFALSNLTCSIFTYEYELF